MLTVLDISAIKVDEDSDAEWLLTFRREDIENISTTATTKTIIAIFIRCTLNFLFKLDSGRSMAAL
jgi:hypothetical protein